MDLADLKNIVVYSATKTGQSVDDAPSNISTFTYKQIQHYGWVSISDVLMRQPGFFPSQDYDRSTVGSRGFFEGWNNNHLLTLIDGIPYNDNIYGTAYTWGITPLVFLENLEIIRGPGSALYGSNATHGLIGMKTADFDKSDNKGRARIRVGNQNLQIYDAVAGVSNKNAALTGSLNHFNTVGQNYSSYDDYLSADGKPVKNEVNDNRSSNYFFTKLEGKGKYAGLFSHLHVQQWSFNTGHGWIFQIPDQPESMFERRVMGAIRYSTPNQDAKLQKEVTIRLQRHSIDWNMRYLRDSAFSGYYPNGVSKHLITHADDLFGRLQLSTKIKEYQLLGGFENTTFYYNGDVSHNSNINLSTFEPNTNNSFTKQGPWLEWIKGNFVNNTGVFAQIITPKYANIFQVTFGTRLDLQSFSFNALDKPATNGQYATEQKTFSAVNPRLAVVGALSPKLTIKAMAGTGFRAPAPSELFGSNTYSLASNLRNLKPEQTISYEFSATYRPDTTFAFKANAFLMQFENQIAYSVANSNLSSNVFSGTNAGLELEGQITLAKGFSGFANFTLVRRLSEEIKDTTIASSNELTWAPQHYANAGFQFRFGRFLATTQARYQGNVIRRSSDSQIAEYAALRSDKIKAWFVADARVAYLITPNLEVAFAVNNMLNQERYLIKTNSLPFDYKMPGISYMVDLHLNL